MIVYEKDILVDFINQRMQEEELRRKEQEMKNA